MKPLWSVVYVVKNYAMCVINVDINCVVDVECWDVVCYRGLINRVVYLVVNMKPKDFEKNLDGLRP